MDDMCFEKLHEVWVEANWSVEVHPKSETYADLDAKRVAAVVDVVE
jgi:hypothetical protein